jgi:hypothetical protein
MNKEKILSALAVLVQSGSQLLHFPEDNGVSLIEKKVSDHEFFFPEFQKMKELGLIRYEKSSHAHADKYVITKKGKLFYEAEQTIKELMPC